MKEKLTINEKNDLKLKKDGYFLKKFDVQEEKLEKKNTF